MNRMQTMTYPMVESDTGWVTHHPRCQDYELSEADFERLIDDPDAIWSLVLAVDERNKHGAENRFQKAMMPFNWVFGCRCREIQQDERDTEGDRKYHERKEAGLCQ
jgi:hypothetical protein